MVKMMVLINVNTSGGIANNFIINNFFAIVHHELFLDYNFGFRNFSSLTEEGHAFFTAFFFLS